MGEYAERKGRSYRLGKPSFWDRVFNDYPEAYAYSRFTREPVTFHDGPFEPLQSDVVGTHSHMPLIGGIDVDVSREDPQKTLRHEQMHHAFPVFDIPPDEQEKYMAPLESNHPRVRETGLRLLPEEADRGLLERLLGIRR